MQGWVIIILTDLSVWCRHYRARYVLTSYLCVRGRMVRAAPDRAVRSGRVGLGQHASAHVARQRRLTVSPARHNIWPEAIDAVPGGGGGTVPASL